MHARSPASSEWEQAVQQWEHDSEPSVAPNHMHADSGEDDEDQSRPPSRKPMRQEWIEEGDEEEGGKGCAWSSASRKRGRHGTRVKVIDRPTPDGWIMEEASSVGDDRDVADAPLVDVAPDRLPLVRTAKGLGKGGPGPGVAAPFDPNNACCNAPCPPGAFCNACDCDRPTEFYVQRWTCVWQQTPLRCCEGGKGKGIGRIDEPCAWTKAWRCNFHQICREDVLKFFRCAPPPRCPVPCGGESECFVPQDAYFAKVFEIGYEECDKQCYPPGECYPVRVGKNPCGADCVKVGGCACCGLYQTCNERWVRIRCRADIPPLLPYEPPLPFYERPEFLLPRRRTRCQCVTCAPAAARSPDLRGLAVPVV